MIGFPQLKEFKALIDLVQGTCTLRKFGVTLKLRSSRNGSSSSFSTLCPPTDAYTKLLSSNDIILFGNFSALEIENMESLNCCNYIETTTKEHIPLSISDKKGEWFTLACTRMKSPTILKHTQVSHGRNLVKLALIDTQSLAETNYKGCQRSFDTCWNFDDNSLQPYPF